MYLTLFSGTLTMLTTDYKNEQDKCGRLRSNDQQGRVNEGWCLGLPRDQLVSS